MRGWTRLDEYGFYLYDTAVQEGHTEEGDQLRQRGFRAFFDRPRSAQPGSFQTDKARVGPLLDTDAVAKIEYRHITAPQPLLS